MVCISSVGLRASCIGDWTSSTTSAYNEYSSDMEVSSAQLRRAYRINCARNAIASLNNSVKKAEVAMSECPKKK